MPRLVPLLEGGAAGSLGPSDLEAMGFEAAAVNLLELALAPGLEVVAAAGGIKAWSAWPGDLYAVAWTSPNGDPPGAAGWRARRRPTLVREADARMTLRSPVDGSLVELDLAELFRAAVREGIEPAPEGCAVTSEPADRARRGEYLVSSGWAEIAGHTDAAEKGSLAADCECATCGIAQVGYIAHLWRQREITAAHLLGRHNLHAMRQALGR